MVTALEQRERVRSVVAPMISLTALLAGVLLLLALHVLPPTDRIARSGAP